MFLATEATLEVFACGGKLTVSLPFAARIHIFRISLFGSAIHGSGCLLVKKP